jgi:cytochrome c556
MQKFAGRLLIVALASAVIAGPLLAEASDFEKARLANYRELGTAFKNVMDELRSGTPETLIIQMSAREIRKASQQQYNWFPAGSGPASGVKTEARAEIWTQPADFKARQDAFAAQAAAFQSAAQSGDVGKIRAAARQLGEACKACHTQFRNKKD